MNKRKNITVIVGTVLVILGLLFMALARTIPGFADGYRIHIYKRQADFWGNLYGRIPCSVAECGFYLLLFGVLFRVIRGIRTFRREGNGKQILAGELAFYWCIAGVLFFLFVMHGGINYSAASFSEEHQLKREGYTLEELAEVCYILEADIEKWADQVERGTDGLFLEPQECGKLAAAAMEQLGEEYAGLAGHYPVPKGLGASWVLSYEQLTGIYSPFTIEANYNREMTAYNIPFTMCHELSHLKGYMREDEANFIAWLACRHSDEAAFSYSGALMGWIYCGNELYTYDKATYRKIRDSLPESAAADLRANTEFWDRHEGLTADISETVNDTYLKWNQQELGIQTYDRVVDLIVNYLLEEE